MDHSRSLPRTRQLGTIVVDGRHHPTALAYVPGAGETATIEVAPIAGGESPASDRRVEIEVSLSTPIDEALSALLGAVTGGRRGAERSIGVGALLPARHACDAVVVAFGFDPDDPGPRAATIRLAGDARAERFVWTRDSTLRDWLRAFDAFCRGPRQSDTKTPLAGTCGPQPAGRATDAS
jgi:hypothetical protein